MGNASDCGAYNQNSSPRFYGATPFPNRFAAGILFEVTLTRVSITTLVNLSINKAHYVSATDPGAVAFRATAIS